MPLNVTANSVTSFPKPDYLTLQNFKRGVITLINESRLPKNALKELKNEFLYEDGQPGPRPGVDWFGTQPVDHPIDGFDYFDTGTASHLIVVSNGTVYRSLDDGVTWNACTGGSTTPGVWTNMNQNGSFLYLTNGTDNLLRYDGTTTLQVYTTLATPSAPTVTKTGLAATTYKYWFKVAQVNKVGFTDASPATTVQVAATRDNWNATTDFVTVTGTVSTSATRVDVYLSEDGLNYYYINSAVVDSGTGAYSFKDDGTSIVVPSTTAPTGNTTTGPKVKELTNVGVRMYGTRDPQNPYRIWFSSATVPGAFSNAYDGGYLDWQPGGKYFPVHAEDYRSGKGDPIATIWCDSADGQGCVLQMSLDTLTIDTISVTVPSAYRLPGSRGTPAPLSVINVLNDYFFYNTQAIYNLGSRAQFLNILSTDEASSNIRPNFRSVSREAEEGIATAYYEANVYFSVPVGSDKNNQTIIYNTEMKAWIPEAFTIGFNKFLRYTDANKSQHLLCLKPGDNRLSEISAGFSGDYGQPFETSLVTGLYQTTSDRFDFQFSEEAEFELANAGGQINVELLGIDRTKGYRSIKIVTLNASSTVTNVGWDTFGWDTTNWDDTSNAPVVVSEASLKRYFPLQKELNAIQWHIFTNSTDARYVLRTLQTWGTPTEAGHPAKWRLKPL